MTEEHELAALDKPENTAAANWLLDAIYLKTYCEFMTRHGQAIYSNDTLKKYLAYQVNGDDPEFKRRPPLNRYATFNEDAYPPVEILGAARNGELHVHDGIWQEYDATVQELRKNPAVKEWLDQRVIWAREEALYYARRQLFADMEAVLPAADEKSRDAGADKPTQGISLPSILPKRLATPLLSEAHVSVINANLPSYKEYLANDGPHYSAPTAIQQIEHVEPAVTTSVATKYPEQRTVGADLAEDSLHVITDADRAIARDFPWQGEGKPRWTSLVEKPTGYHADELEDLFSDKPRGR